MLGGAAAVFVTGAAVMVAELIAARLTAPFYGQSTATWAALAGVTLLGVTLGNYVGGVLSSGCAVARVARPYRCTDPLKLYNSTRPKNARPFLVALLGAVGGAVALAALPSLLAPLAAMCGSGNAGLFLFALAAFLPPTALLGLVSPAVAAGIVRADRNGSDLGTLYFASMLGYTLGSAAAGLYLPFVLPAPAVCRCAAAALVIAAVVLVAAAWRWGGRSGFVSRVEVENCRGTVARPNQTQSSLQLYNSTRPKNISALAPLAHVFLVGFIGMASELALARLVTPVLGGSHVVWSAVFVTFIGFMGVGGIVGGRAADRFASRVPAKALYAALFAALYATVLFQTRVLGLWTMGCDAAVRIALHVLVGFAPYAFVLGFLSAFLLQKATAPALKAGDRASIGLAYAANGVGSACGSFFAGMLCVGSASLLASLPGAERPLPAEIVVGGRQAVLFRGESSYNSVTVTARRDNPHSVTLWLDRIPHTTVDTASPSFLQATYTRLLDVAVDVLSPTGGRRVFVIGGGGYALPRKWAAENARTGLFRRDETNGCPYAELTVAEIDPLVYGCARRFMDAPADDGVVRNHVADGRRLADQLVREGATNRYDVVIGDTIGDAAIPYHLTTREFFAKIADSLLKPDGVYMMHVLDALDDPGLLSSIVKTLKAAFPHVVAYSYSGVGDVRQSFVVAASRRPLDVAPMADELVRRYPEALPIQLDEAVCEGLARREGAIELTDAFAPVERFVWRVLSRDVQYRAYALAEKMKELRRDGDGEGAFALARRVLEMQPEQTDALDVVDEAAQDGVDGAEALLKAQAARPSVCEEAKVRYAVYLRNKGRAAETLALWREIARRWPDNPHYAATLKDLEK